MYSATQDFDGDGTTTITISRNGHTVTYTDSMEPEDATFGRDLSWIIDELQRAYDCGYNEGSIVYNDV